MAAFQAFYFKATGTTVSHTPRFLHTVFVISLYTVLPLLTDTQLAGLTRKFLTLFAFYTVALNCRYTLYITCGELACPRETCNFCEW